MLSLVSSVILLLGWTIPYSEAIRCFSCDGCRDPFYPALDHVQDCGNNQMDLLDAAGMSRQQRCVKIVAPDGSVQRGCGASRSGMIGCERSLQGVVCTCFTDLCNGSPGSLTSRNNHIRIALLSLLVYLFL
ncbi:hypothetical protein BV898_02319 [Hypsibius exemplaris]|uniref:Protein sleepless n=1 Tax=Hypsibius exemplaris TaxID=2072580 RepID=A0A1W0X8Z0_HYPEX|nr:hypothetical protein BV898_02319 [Hypsibius exemplaris]